MTGKIRDQRLKIKYHCSKTTELRLQIQFKSSQIKDQRLKTDIIAEHVSPRGGTKDADLGRVGNVERHEQITTDIDLNVMI